jgi:hypothetical protein
MRKQHTARATCANAKGVGVAPPPPAATGVSGSGERSAVWLEDEHVTLNEDDAQSGMAGVSKKRYDDTERIWCPQH